MFDGQLKDTLRGVGGQHIWHSVDLVQYSDSFRVFKSSEPGEITFLQGCGLLITLVILILKLLVKLFRAFLLSPSFMVGLVIIFNVLVRSPKHEALESLLVKKIVQNRIEARTHVLLEVLDFAHVEEQFRPS